MLRWLPPPLVGVLTFILMLAALLFCFAVFVPVALLKLATPSLAGRAWWTRVALEPICSGWWWGLNRFIYLLLHGPRRDIVIDGGLDRSKSWLLVCNHQSWADIPLLVDILGRQLPFPRFFLKRQLLWVPVIGFVCWAMDMPFMKRHSKADVAANPALRLQDLEATRAACDKNRRIPMAMVTFVEGTRSTEAKRAARGSPYRHLLRPKAAGLSFTLNAMGERFAGVVDVTLSYAPSDYGPLGSFLCGDQRDIRVRVRVLPVPRELIGGDYQEDAAFRERFQLWINGIWERKDRELDQLAGLPAGAAAHNSGTG
ncbi:MAG: acetyltransferase [Nevskia sp.]|nr:acetyltransferase [Nevskia sp.]